jgi:hypothetical protein
MDPAMTGAITLIGEVRLDRIVALKMGKGECGSILERRKSIEIKTDPLNHAKMQSKAPRAWARWCWRNEMLRRRWSRADKR